MRKAVVLILSLLPLRAFAEGAAAPPPLPPEVKKTVDAFNGTWVFEGTLTGMPGAKEPIKFKETFSCKKVIASRAVSCSGNAKIPGMGAMEDAALVTWDVESKAMRFVGMDSMGEVHDHKCTWKDDKSVSCDPLAVTVDGQPATVDLVMSWTDAKNMAMTETTTMKDGSKMAFDGKAVRK